MAYGLQSSQVTSYELKRIILITVITLGIPLLNK